jgi:outer membrane lipase/esterase
MKNSRPAMRTARFLAARRLCARYLPPPWLVTVTVGLLSAVIVLSPHDAAGQVQGCQSISPNNGQDQQTGIVGLPLIFSVTTTGNCTVTWSVMPTNGGRFMPNTGLRTAFTPLNTGMISVMATANFTCDAPSATTSATTSCNVVTFTVIVSALTLTKVSGENQTGTVGVPLNPLIVLLTNSGGEQGGLVSWSITGNGRLSSPTTTTDRSGLAQNIVTPTGPGPIAVTARANLTRNDVTVPSNFVTFNNINVPSPMLAVVSGNNQTGVINAPLPQPLIVSVTGTSATEVTWDAHGGGTASPNPSRIVNGVSQTFFTLGATSAPITVTASISSGGVTTTASFSVNNATQAALPGGLRSFTAMAPVAITTATVQTTNLAQRLAALRKGAGGLSMSGLMINIDGQPVSLDAVTSLVPSLGKGGGASADPGSILGGRLGVFLTGQGSFGTQEESSREPGFVFHTAGLTLGGDYRLTDNLALGGSFGYVNSKTELDASAGHFTTNGYSFSGYGTYYVSDKIYLDGIVTYGWNNYQTRRNILETGATAKGSPGGTQFSVAAGGGYLFNFGPLSIGPTARVNYIWSYIDNFKESGAGLFDLQVTSQTIQSLTTDFGGQVSYALSFSWGVLQPLVTFEWEHQYMGNSYFINGSLLADPAATTAGVPTNNPDRNYFNLGAGFTVTFKRNLSGFFNYKAILGQNLVTNNAFTAGLRYQFE